MGEYAIRSSDNTEVKIGTCEDMYYLRAEQRQQVRALSGNVNPAGADALVLRFRFPWPDEDNTLPGDFHKHGFQRAIAVPGSVANPNTEHYTVQFVAQAGYVISLPCPESGKVPDGLTIHRNGFAGAVQLVQQKLLADGRLVPVCRCGGCGTKWRMEDQSEIEALALAFRAEADRKEQLGQHNGTGKQDRLFYDVIADRILLGALILEPA